MNTIMNIIMSACAPIIKEATTNCCDVKIVISICITVGIIVLIIATATCEWHEKSLNVEIELKKQEFESKTASSQKTNSEKATDLLKELSALVKSKEGDVNKETLDQMVDIYKTLKKDFDDEK